MTPERSTSACLTGPCNDSPASFPKRKTAGKDRLTTLLGKSRSAAMHRIIPIGDWGTQLRRSPVFVERLRENEDMKLSLKAKFAAAFGSLLLLTMALGGLAIVKMSDINDASTVIAENWLPSVDVVNRINTSTSDLRIPQYRHVASLDEAEMRAVEGEVETLLTSLNQQRATYEALISSPEERAIYDQFSDKFKQYLSAHERMLALSRQNLNEQAIFQ